RFGFAQEANDLFFGKALLHVQSPSVRELDSKLRCYSKSGGRRIYSSSEPGPRRLPRDGRSQGPPLFERQASTSATQAERR
ncbi:hypothetical protein, partial [Xanthomonas phaseoli]|uniref:hypothetical protein n=1 Tax=Xanthomonas phaseoli TaxID=1985254 RepID=UPI001E60F149